MYFDGMISQYEYDADVREAERLLALHRVAAARVGGGHADAGAFHDRNVRATTPRRRLFPRPGA